MTGSDLTTELRHRAEATAQAILDAAHEEASRIALESDRSIEIRRKETMTDRETEYRRKARAAIAAERHDAMRNVLVARAAAVERVLAHVRELLPQAVTSDRYTSLLPNELRQALRFIGSDGATIHCFPSLEPSIRVALGERADLRVQVNDDVGPGFTVQSDAGGVLVDGRLQTRLDRLRESIAIDINERLEELSA